MTNTTLGHPPRIEEELFQKAFEEGPIGMAIVGLDYRFIKVNNNLCRLLGYSNNELTTLTFPDITHPDDIDADVELARQLFNGEIPHYRIIKRYIKKNGDICWIKLSASVIRDAHGAALHALAMIEDITEQKAVEQSLRASEERFRTFAETIDAVAWIATPMPERVLFVNNAFERTWGYPAEKLYRDARLWIKAIHAEDRPAVQSDFENFLKGKTAEYTAEYRIARPDGEIRWIADHGVKMRDEAGTQLRICGIAVDITQRKETERAVTQAEATLEALFDNAPLAMVISEGKTEKVLKTNRRFKEIIGYSIKEMPDVSHWWPLAYPDPAYRRKIKNLWHQRMLQSIRDNKALIPVEARVRCKNGDSRIFECHATSIGQRNLVIFVDLTKTRHLEKQLREAETRFRSAFLYAPIGISLVSREGRWLQVNKILCDLLDYSAEEMLGMTFQDITYADDLETDLALMRELLDGKREHYTMEKRYIDKHGKIIWILLAASVVRDEQGKVLYFISQIQDINERKRIEQEREQLIKELREALAKVKTLRGLLPICSSCKKIRDDKGYWNQIEAYISTHTDVLFSHSVCPACAKKLYAEFEDLFDTDDES